MYIYLSIFFILQGAELKNQFLSLSVTMNQSIPPHYQTKPIDGKTKLLKNDISYTTFAICKNDDCNSFDLLFI